MADPGRPRVGAWGRLAVLLLALAMLGCGETARPPPEPGPPAPAPESIFYLGRLPFLTATEVVRDTDPFLRQLATHLGVDRVVMVLAPDYAGVLGLLLDGRVDAAWFGTEAYREARAAGKPVEALVVPTRHGRSWYEGVVICRADSGLLSLQDLKGRSFGFVDPRSSSGWAAPKRLLEKAGLEVPGDLRTKEPGKPDYLSKHDNVVHSVYFGKVDAGAVYAEAVADTFEGQPSKQAELVVLARTGRIPNEPIVVREEEDAARKARIRDAFLALELDPDTQALFGGVESFAPWEEPEPGPEVAGS